MSNTNDNVLIDDETMTLIGAYPTVDAAVAAAEVHVPGNNDYMVYNEEDLAKQLTAQEQVDIINSVNHADVAKRNNRFNSKAQGAKAIVEAARLITPVLEELTPVEDKPAKAPRSKLPVIRNPKGRGTRNGNVATVWELCYELENQYGRQPKRSEVILAASAMNIATATVTTQFQRWRHRTDGQEG